MCSSSILPEESVFRGLMRSFVEEADEPASWGLLVLFFGICVEYKMKERGNKVYNDSRFIHPVRKVCCSSIEIFGGVGFRIPTFTYMVRRKRCRLSAAFIPAVSYNIGKKEHWECYLWIFFYFSMF